MRSGKQGLTLATIVIVAVALTISALYFFVIRKPKQQNGRLSVSVRLKWLHQAQFAGFYVADAKGFYAQGGLTVSLAGCGKTRFERSLRRRNLHQTPLRYSSTEQASPKGLSFGNSRLNSSPNFDGRSVNGDSKTKRLHVGLECI